MLSLKNTDESKKEFVKTRTLICNSQLWSFNYQLSIYKGCIIDDTVQWKRWNNMIHIHKSVIKRIVHINRQALDATYVGENNVMRSILSTWCVHYTLHKMLSIIMNNLCFCCITHSNKHRLYEKWFTRSGSSM